MWPKFLLWAEENDIIIPELLDKKIDRMLNGLKNKECPQSENLDSLMDGIIQAHLLDHTEVYVKSLPSSYLYWWV